MKKVEGAKPEYDFSKGVRGQHAKRFREGTNIVKLDEDWAQKFPDSKAVNDALRAYLAEQESA